MIIRKFLNITTLPSITRGSAASLFHFSQTPKINPNKNYYDILEVPRDANTDHVLKAHSKLAIIYDPFINPANRDKFNDINEARQILSNEKLRKQYDKERFFVKFTDEMNNRFQHQSEQPYETKKTDKYSFDLTPEEEEVMQKNKRYLKRGLIGIIGLAIFLPFVLWKGGDQPPAYSEAGYPLRPSSQHRANLAQAQYEQQQVQQAYQQLYPNSYPQEYQQRPQVVVTGQFVTD